MNFQFYVEKLKSLENYKKFVKENSSAFVCSCFFVVDEVGKDSKQHFDFWIPEEKKMFSFQLENNGELIPVDEVGNFVPEKIELNLDFDFNYIKKIIEEKMLQEGIKNKIQKMLLSLQKKEGKHFLVGTVFISLMGMIKVSVDLDEMKLLDFEKKSFFDIMKVKKK